MPLVHGGSHLIGGAIVRSRANRRPHMRHIVIIELGALREIAVRDVPCEEILLVVNRSEYTASLRLHREVTHLRLRGEPHLEVVRVIRRVVLLLCSQHGGRSLFVPRQSPRGA